MYVRVSFDLGRLRQSTGTKTLGNIGNKLLEVSSDLPRPPQRVPKLIQTLLVCEILNITWEGLKS